MSTSSTQESYSVCPDPVEMLQRLIRFDTTNPPGNERECVAYISNLLTEAGCDFSVLGSSPDRPNLIARLKGQGTAPPLLRSSASTLRPRRRRDYCRSNVAASTF